MFKLNNKNIRTTSMTWFWANFTPFSVIFIVDFEQENVSWDRYFANFNVEIISIINFQSFIGITKIVSTRRFSALLKPFSKSSKRISVLAVFPAGIQ